MSKDNTEMDNIIMDGKKVSNNIKKELKTQIEEWVSNGNKKPKLSIIGSDNSVYVKNSIATANEIGIDCLILTIPDSEDDFLKRINELNADHSIDGILVQLPLPNGMNERKIFNEISPDKDVEGMNEINVGRLCLDMKCFVPCTALGVKELLKHYHVETFGKNTVVVGRSKVTGLPIAQLLHSDENSGAGGMESTVTICHINTPSTELKKFCKLADIIITATGIPCLITADMVKPDCCVIDVGFTGITDKESGKYYYVGDVDFDKVKEVAKWITPVPGGVGPMTVVMLMRNVFAAAKQLVNK